MFYCHECAIEFAEKEGYNLHLQSAHSPTKRKCKKKTKLRMVKIALKSSPKKKQYVILNTTNIFSLKIKIITYDMYKLKP